MVERRRTFPSFPVLGVLRLVTVALIVAPAGAANTNAVAWEAQSRRAGWARAAADGLQPRANAAAAPGNPVRLSDVGPPQDIAYEALEPAVAYNSANNQYLVVWHGDDNTGGLVAGEVEIFGQRLDAATGGEIGANDFRISNMGPDANTGYSGQAAAVAYNSDANQYLVVWRGDDEAGDLVAQEFEIFGQLLNAANGAKIGGNFRISEMGPDGDATYQAHAPAVAYSSAAKEYLVVWQGLDDVSAVGGDEVEIFGQRIDATNGAKLGGNFRISDMGEEGNLDFGAFDPAVAYNSLDNQYLVIWRGDDDTGSLVNNEYEIFGQLLNAATGGEIGGDFRISAMGPDGDAGFQAFTPAVAYNANANAFLVVWQGEDDSGGLVKDENEIFGQLLDAATGDEIGGGFRISEMGPDGNTTFSAQWPGVAYNGAVDQYLVVWYGDEVLRGLAGNELEVYGQFLAGANGAEVGSDFRISHMGPAGDTSYAGALPAVAASHTAKTYLVVWSGDGNTGGLVDDEFEIFGQLWQSDAELFLPFIKASLTAPAAASN